MKKLIALTAAVLLMSNFIKAGGPEDSLKLFQEQLRIMDSIEGSLHYKTGKIILGNGIATINVPEGFKFLESAEAKYVVGEIWGNPITEAPLGALFPASSGATDPGGYAFIIKFEDIGYVKDKDADKINYDDLLKSMKEESARENAERMRVGGFTMNLLNWAATPYYDKEKKILHWAKEFSVSGQEDHTLNYDIRILGRKGVLNLQAVSGMEELDSVKAHINDVLSMVAFTEGNRYSDFDSKTDKVAAWTIGGLVAGKILAKVGFWAVIAKFLKFIIAGIVIAGGAIWRFISGRKKKQEEFVYQPQQAPDNNDQATPPAAQ
ncbi:MAG: DUF2167 domain-containing protein [Chitinophagaceae bacterium]|nr:DUF2167 domain-containing protein [Chitinophagaceae bacterium]